MQSKLSIIVAYRDRAEHLAVFVPALEASPWLAGIDYRMLIVEQADDRPFNKGRLLNAGVRESPEADYYCFHDIDMIPLRADYSWVEGPTHLAAEVEQFGFKLPYPQFFGGVTLFDRASYATINGHSNRYWGWGAEDDDLFRRCAAFGLQATRRIGRFRSLPHPRNVDRDLYRENLQRYRDFARDAAAGPDAARAAIAADGLSSVDYAVRSSDAIGARTTLIRLQI